MLAASHEILEECINVGGSVTGEHGIGVEKIDFMPKLFTPEDLDMMLRLRTAFNPDSRCSPAQDAADGGGVHRAEQGGATGGAVSGTQNHLHLHSGVRHLEILIIWKLSKRIAAHVKAKGRSPAGSCFCSS